MIYVPDVVENVKKDGFQLSDFFTINKNNYKEYLSKTIVGGLTGYIGALGLNAFFSAPLVGVLNTLSESISGNIHSREELLINFSISTMISFLTLGTPRITLKFKKPCIPRVLPNKFNRIMESILYNFEKIGYYYGQSIDTSVSLTLILLEVIKN